MRWVRWRMSLLSSDLGREDRAVMSRLIARENFLFWLFVIIIRYNLQRQHFNYNSCELYKKFGGCVFPSAVLALESHLTGGLAVRLLLRLPGQGDLVPLVVVERLPLRLDGGVQLTRPLVNGEADPSVLEVDEDVVLAMTWVDLWLVWRQLIVERILLIVVGRVRLSGPCEEK